MSMQQEDALDGFPGLAAPENSLDLSNPNFYINRELSWLAFNERVLDQARDSSHPLLERVKFLAIVGSNLDEFFMVRIATLTRKLLAGLDDVSADGRTVTQQLDEAHERARTLLE